MNRRTVQELGAAFVIVAMLLGFTWFAWLRLPADRSVITAKATVVSLAPGLGSKSNLRQPYALLSLQLDDGMPVTLTRPLSCLPRVKPGDRIQLSGVHNHGGAILWSIVGEPCPE
ncbi:hypothetical protein [Sphingomonas sp. UNC305MFCol5.2]|uniref:hypothetical protein n=1 Tax=Sphingomonas sp. UNC305MFCol5.2 TaxID=1449076 RepID=UPI0004A71343|nr:hypothetical protein [Sphingomonas sp. UNC305MFCol5.2]